jgi:hypothetical protein
MVKVNGMPHNPSVQDHDSLKVGRKSMYFVLVRKSGNRKHFILECEALKDSRKNYAGILAASSWDNLFNKEFVEKGAIIVKLHRKRAEYKRQMEKQSVP